MNRKIMILSSDKTGHGHESIVQALKEQFLEQGGQADIRVVNGFSIGGPFGRFVEQLYFPVVQYFPCLWKLFFQFASQLPYAVNHITAKCIRKTFLKALREYHPDLIVTVHPAFVGSVNCLLERYGMNIPVIVLVADLVTISGLWADHRSSCILAPTEEAKWGLMEFGVEESKIRVFGFPVRSRFNHPGTASKGIRPAADENPSLDILVFANAFNKSKTVTIIRNLLDSFDCTVTLLTGRDEKLKGYIQRKLPDKTGHKLLLPGYVVNMEQYMQTNDLLITKAGPNIVMEAVHCGIPVIITGNLPGQEEGTTEWIASQGLGTVSRDTGSLIETIRDLLDNDRLERNKIANNQMNYKNRNAAREMVEFISDYSAKGHTYSEVSCMEELGTL